MHPWKSRIIFDGVITGNGTNVSKNEAGECSAAYARHRIDNDIPHNDDDRVIDQETIKRKIDWMMIS